jgi:hypothetical protein
VRWTVFKSQFCGFAAQKYSTKLQLKNCRLARRYVGQKLKRNASGKSQKQKLRAASFVIFSFLVRLVFTLYKECKD